ncbi:hypothetical protein BC941DRAFT_437566 [Chlamydoabsidia padenii]|nr:hypothetical protein BC941DRAFT_437566 [Chlamydoabsidia padenii]
MPSVADTKRKQQRSLTSTATSVIFGIASPMSPITTHNSNHSQESNHSEPAPPSDNVSSFRPTSSGLVHSDIIWEHATIKGFLTKHIPPVFSFTKNRKRRYVVLADRYLYCFKTDTPTSKYREMMELTGDSQVFVTDYLAGVVFCLEIRKPSRGIHEGTTWFLQADDAEDMKNWLNRIKKTIQYLADHHQHQREPITTDKLSFVQSAEDLFLIHGGMDHPDSCNAQNGLITPRSSEPEIDTTPWASRNIKIPHSPPLSPTYDPAPPSSSSSMSSVGSQRFNSIRSSQSLGGLLPPPLPPPTSKLPPPPSYF